MVAPLDPPFGTFALPSEREEARVKAGTYGDTRWGRLNISRLRRKAMAGSAEPYDVVVAPYVNARLYPSKNRCEKRAFAGVQVWDQRERAALKTAVESSENDEFVFLDVGANVGLYSLFVNAYAKALEKSVRILAIEPGLETCARLEANINASEAPVQIIRAAVSDVPGTGFLGGGGDNRGEAKLVDGGHDVEPVVIDTLARICRTQGITHINAMKLDIEGHDFKALSGFFEDAPTRLHPEVLILETGKDPSSPLTELCKSSGYAISETAGLNTIMVKTPAEADRGEA